MAQQPLTVNQICEMALQKMGAYSINDSAARPEHIERAVHWLSAIIRHLAGTRPALWLVPATIPIALTADTASYQLDDSMGANVPANGTQFPVKCMVRDSSGNDWPVDILDREQFEALYDKTATGKPTAIYIDRTRDPALYVNPVPGTTGDYTLRLTVQTFGPDIRNTELQELAEVRVAWELYLVYALAYELGSGAVRRIPDGELQLIENKAETLLMDLEGFEGQEHADDGRRVCDYHDF